MSEFTAEGIIIDRFPEIKEAFISDTKLRFGDDTLVDSEEAIIGGLCNLFCSGTDEQNQLIEGVVSAFDPTTAEGVYLSRLVAFNGLTRKEAVYSTCSVNCTAGTAATVIPEGAIAANQDETQLWVIDSDLPLNALETASVSVTAKDPGPILAPVGTITKIMTPEYSWESVTNPLSSTVGRTEETDPVLRRRRDDAAKARGASSLPALKRNIDALDAVESSQVYINNKDIVDEYGNAPGVTWFIVKGDSDENIAEVIAESCSGGSIYRGAVEVDYVDPINNEIYPIKFDRPEEIETKIQMTLLIDSAFPDDGDSQIKQKIVDYYAGNFTIDGRAVEGFDVGKPVVYSRIYSPINSIPGHSILNMDIGLLAGSFAKVDLPMEIYQQGVISEDDIDITLTEV